MADEQDLTFPDLPVGQWWKLRALFKSNLPKTVNIEYLISTLKIVESTARNTYRNLGILGFIDKDGKPTDRANDWRADNLYSQICREISEQVYPPDLRDIAQSANDRNTLVSWFTRKTRIGDTAAHKNAAIFEVIFDGNLQRAKEIKDGKSQEKTKVQAKAKRAAASLPIAELTIPVDSEAKKGGSTQLAKPQLPDTPPRPSIHIDIQIHISPDAKPEQIEQIFTSIEKHLYKPR